MTTKKWDSSALKRPVSNSRWEHKLRGEEAEWWDWVLDECIENEAIYPWVNILSSFKENFPESPMIPDESTLRRAMARCLKERDKGDLLNG